MVSACEAGKGGRKENSSTGHSQAIRREFLASTALGIFDRSIDQTRQEEFERFGLVRSRSISHLVPTRARWGTNRSKLLTDDNRRCLSDFADILICLDHLLDSCLIRKRDRQRDAGRREMSATSRSSRGESALHSTFSPCCGSRCSRLQTE